jgi:hypothetical protein
MMLIDNKFELGQTVYLNTDPEQLPRMVTKINVIPNSVYYELSCGTNLSSHYDIEMSLEKNVLISTSN